MLDSEVYGACCIGYLGVSKTKGCCWGYELYKYPQGSSLVTPCPVEKQAAPGACAALFTGKGDGERCPQSLGPCPKALGRGFKLVCGGGLSAGRRTTWCHSIGTWLSTTRPTPSPRIPQLFLRAPLQSASRRSALRVTPKATRRETAATLACQDYEDTCLHVTDRPEFFGSMSGVENQTRGVRSCSACPVMVVFPRIHPPLLDR